MKDFYYILGTASNATPPEIDAAYQKLARKFRQGEGEPDDFMDAHFREIAEAYDVLRDARRRSKYDAAFKKNQKRYLSVFKLKYLNIAVAITFLAVTGLFADYVIRTIRGHEGKKVVVQKPAAAASPVVLARPKKHHKFVTLLVKKHPPKIDSIPKHPHQAIPIVAPKPTPDSTYTATLHANITGIIYLHQSPDYTSAVLAKIPDAAQVRVLQKGKVFYKVMFNDQTGYVLKSCVGGEVRRGKVSPQGLPQETLRFEIPLLVAGSFSRDPARTLR